MTGLAARRGRIVWRAALGLALGSAVALAGCHGDPTSVVIQANTNLWAGTEVDEIVIEVVGEVVDSGTEPPAEFRFKIDTSDDLPVVLGLYPSSNPQDQLDVRATARRLGTVRVDQRLPTGFVPGRIERLTMELDSLCHGVSCPDDQLCDDQRGTCPGQKDDGGAPPDGP